MNPSTNEAPGVQLPSPRMEQIPTGVNTPELVSRSSERTPEVFEKPTVPSPTAPVVMQSFAVPVFPQATQAATAQNDSVTTTSHLQVSDDDDLIEKEWVNKAKRIVESTRDDPYKQTEELTVFKADYMQKRYGKTIKLNQ